LIKTSLMPDPLAIPIAQIRRNLERTLAALPTKAGAIIVQHSNQAFVLGGWTDDSFEPWTPIQSKKAKDEGRAILVLTGRLRRSIRVINTTVDSVTVGTNVPYAKIHNEGGTALHYAHGQILNFDHAPTNGRWRFGKARTVQQQRGIKTIRRASFKEYTTKMPQRKFLGNSRRLTRDISTMFTTDITNAFKIK